MLTRTRTAVTAVVASLSLALGSSVVPAQAAIDTGTLGPGDLAGVSAVVPNSSQQRISDLQDLQFGLFMHWGVYSMFEGIYKGQVQGIGYPE